MLHCSGWPMCSANERWNLGAFTCVPQENALTGETPLVELLSMTSGLQSTSGGSRMDSQTDQESLLA